MPVIGKGGRGDNNKNRFINMMNDFHQKNYFVFIFFINQLRFDFFWLSAKDWFNKY